MAGLSFKKAARPAPPFYLRSSLLCQAPDRGQPALSAFICLGYSALSVFVSGWLVLSAAVSGWFALSAAVAD